jgi:hypothetical protein
MEKVDIRVIAAAAIAVVIVLAAVLGQQLGKDDDQQATPPASTAPAATLPGGTPVPEEPAETAPAATVGADIEAAQTKAAEDFIAAYFSYSYKDARPDAYLDRSQPFMSPEFQAATKKVVLGDDGGTTVEWANIRNERRVVTVVQTQGELDPFYDPTPERSIVAVQFVQSTQDAVGTGGTGEPQTKRLVVVKVGDAYLVDSIFETGTEGT